MTFKKKKTLPDKNEKKNKKKKKKFFKFLFNKFFFFLFFFFFFFFFFLLFAFFFFFGLHPRHMEIPRLGVESELQLQAYTTATATRVRAASVTHTTAHGNAGSLTQWARPAMEPAFSWFPARFFSYWAMKGSPKGNLFFKLMSLDGST